MRGNVYKKITRLEKKNLKKTYSVRKYFKMLQAPGYFFKIFFFNMEIFLELLTLEPT